MSGDVHDGEKVSPACKPSRLIGEPMTRTHHLRVAAPPQGARAGRVVRRRWVVSGGFLTFSSVTHLFLFHKYIFRWRVTFPFFPPPSFELPPPPCSPSLHPPTPARETNDASYSVESAGDGRFNGVRRWVGGFFFCDEGG